MEMNFRFFRILFVISCRNRAAVASGLFYDVKNFFKCEWFPYHGSFSVFVDSSRSSLRYKRQ